MGLLELKPLWGIMDINAVFVNSDLFHQMPCLLKIIGKKIFFFSCSKSNNLNLICLWCVWLFLRVAKLFGFYIIFCLPNFCVHFCWDYIYKWIISIDESHQEYILDTYSYTHSLGECENWYNLQYLLSLYIPYVFLLERGM